MIDNTAQDVPDVESQREKWPREYSENPLIQTFPDIPDDDGWRDVLEGQNTRFDEKDRNAPPHVRIHSMELAFSSFRIATPAQLQVLSRLRLLHMAGYVWRNPLSPEFRKRVAEDRRAIIDGRDIPERFFKRRLGGIISGYMGVGKTTLIEYYRSTLSAVARHQLRVDDAIRVETQVLIVILELFETADLRDLAVEFFAKLGQLVGNPNLGRDYGLNSCPEHMTQTLIYLACRDYNVGMIVVDECQNMANRGDHRVVVGYLVRLMNQIGVPVVVIGTPEIDDLVTTSGAFGRRLCGMERLVPFEKGSTLWLAAWRTVAQYRYIDLPFDAPALANAMHDATLGIPDLVIKLFSLIQARLLMKKNAQLTESIIAETADAFLWPVRKQLDEIKSCAKKPSVSPKVTIAAIRKYVEEFQRNINLACAALGAEPIFAEKKTLPVELGAPGAASGDGLQNGVDTKTPEAPADKTGGGTNLQDALRTMGVFGK